MRSPWQSQWWLRSYPLWMPPWYRLASQVAASVFIPVWVAWIVLEGTRYGTRSLGIVVTVLWVGYVLLAVPGIWMRVQHWRAQRADWQERKAPWVTARATPGSAGFAPPAAGDAVPHEAPDR